MTNASIIIRTFNEAEFLGQTLEIVFKQDFREFEVIIIDSGSTDQTLLIACKYPALIKEIPKETFTYGYALNLGAELANGEFLVFISGHSVPCNRQWLSNLIEPFSDESVVGVCGKQVPHPGAQYSEKLKVERYFDKPKGIMATEDLILSNSNAAIRKKNWEALKFDEIAEAGEDLIWAWTQWKQKKPIYFQPSAAVFHSHNYTWARLTNKLTHDYLSLLRVQSPIIAGYEKLPSLCVHAINALLALKNSLLHFIKTHSINIFNFWDFWRANFILRTVRYQTNQKLLADPEYLTVERSYFNYIK